MAAAVGMAGDLAQSFSIAMGAVLIGVVDHRIMYVLMGAAGAACAVAVLLRPPAAPPVVASLADGPDPAAADGTGRGPGERLATPAPV